MKNHVGSYIRGFQKAHLNLLNIVYCTKMYYGGLTHSRMWQDLFFYHTIDKRTWQIFAMLNDIALVNKIEISWILFYVAFKVSIVNCPILNVRNLSTPVPQFLICTCILLLTLRLILMCFLILRLSFRPSRVTDNIFASSWLINS